MALQDPLSLIHAFDEPIAVVDADGRIRAVNDAWLAFGVENGMEADYTYQGVSYAEICRAAKRVDFMEAMSVHDGLMDVLAGRIDRFQTRYPCHSPSRRRWFDAFIRPIDLEEGRGALVRHVEVAAGGAAETPPGDDRAAVGRLFQHLPAMQHSIDTDRRLVAVSDAWLRRLGFERQDVLGHGLVDFLTEGARREALDRHLPALFRDGYLRSARLDFVTSNGAVVPCLLDANAAYDPTGAFLHSHAFLTDISDAVEASRRAGEATARAESLRDRLSMVTRQLGVGFFEYDLDARSAYCDDRTIAMFELTPGENTVPYPECLGAIHPDDLRTLDENLAAIARGEATGYHDRRRVRLGDGTNRCIEVRAARLPDGPDAGVRIAGICWDVTEDVRRDEDLRLKESAIESANDGIVLTLGEEADYAVTYVNPAFERITGYAASEIVGGNCRLLQGDLRDQPELQTIRDALSRKRPVRVVLQNVRRDGEEYSQLLSITPVPPRAPDQVWRYIGIQQDVTEERRKTQTLAQTVRLLETAEEMANVGHWLVKLPEFELFWSPAVHHLHGTDPGAYVPTVDAAIDFYHVEDRDRVRAAVRGALDRGEDFSLEARIVSASGQVNHVRSTGHCMMDSCGQVAELFGICQDITQEVQAAQVLARSEEHYRSLVETAKIIVWQAEYPSCRFTYVSPHAADLSGYSVEEWLEDDFLGRLVHPDDAQETLTYCLAEAAAGRDHEVECRVITKGGDTIWIRDITTVLVEDGEPVGLRGLMIDVTERRQAEERLRDTLQWMKILFDQSPAAVIAFDLMSRVTHWNAAAERIFGHSGEDVIGLDCLQLLVPDDAQNVVRRIFKELLDGVGGDHSINDNLHKNGRRLTCEWYNSVLRDGAGTPVGIISIALDITETLRQRSFVEAILKHAPAAISINDEEGRYVATSRFIEDLWEIEPGGLIDEHPGDHLPPPIARTLVEMQAEVSATCEPSRRDIEFDVGGRRRFFDIMRFPLALRDGGVSTTCTIGIDRTDQHATQQELAHLQKREALGQLTGGVAHDFNNLLSVVLTNLELLREMATLDAQQRAMLDACLRATNRGGRLTKRLLAYAQRQILKPEAFDVAELVHELQRLLERAIPENIVVRLDVPKGLPPIFADPGQLQDALINLVFNARDALTDGGRICIMVSRADKVPARLTEGAKTGVTSWMAIRVSDDGPGIPRDIQERVFEPFFTTKATRSGSGLGLSMVSGFAEQSGGSVELTSTEGAGTTVTLLLPIRATAGATDPAGSADQILAAGIGETVLLVEDEAEVRESLKVLIDSLGYNAITAADAEAAMHQLTSVPDIRIVVSDVVMPGKMQGTDLAGWIAENLPRTKVLLISGYAGSVLDGERRRDQDIPVLSKPIRRQELSRWLNDLVN